MRVHGHNLQAAMLVLPAVLASVTASAHADTIYVCWDGSGDYLTIQEGIDAAQDGDEVVVCDGTYTGDGNRDLDFDGKAITVRSANGPETCIIDGEVWSVGFEFRGGETEASRVQGFTIRNAYNGIYCDQSSPTILNCTVTGSHTNGVVCGWADPTLIGCTITENAAGDGGGIWCYCSNPTITDCTIARNTSG